MDTKEEYRKWEESAYYWDLYRSKVEQIYAPITQAILEQAQISANHRILDIGGGSGEPTLTIKAKTGAEIFFTDPAFRMAAFARAEALKRNLQNVYFCACSGDGLPFPDQTFDRIVSRISIMFIPDATKAITEMLRVTRNSGRITIAVWNDLKKNLMHSVPTDALRPFIPPEPTPPDALGAFRFSEPGKLTALFRGAGAKAIEESTVDFEITAIASIDEFWDIRSQMSESMRNKLAQLSPDQRGNAATAVKQAVQNYYANGAMRFPASIRVITVRVP